MAKLTVIGLSVLVILFGISVMLDVPDTRQPIAGYILIGVALVNILCTIANKRYGWLK